ncbi:DedA family protein [Acidovorax sp. HDW3]|uniref:YqaA family protein n=1 Tax=Acidovorax sp. HDW3 TaxID=2714923 RepID=UPI00140D2A6F|nr:VTT domain-containing protein [Acidovorax sp. HDW3]QIL44761.1 DedA family protein [Acidovorax sp. HDW3]
MEIWMQSLLSLLALPQWGLGTLFVVALVSATLLPLGSEPALFGLLQLNPGLFWPAIFVATAGNTLGGGISWWLGLGTHRMVDRAAGHPTELRALTWLRRFGARACLLSWLPIVGDPLCAVAGWLRLPFWPCMAYMAVGKFLRYLVMTTALIYLWPLLPN